ncbi:MAG: 23S rRNA (uracil(1939)-C(5))-methyltransferase RlmD [Pseudomonadota bacterium]
MVGVKKVVLKKGQELELEVTDVAFGGRGIAKVDGMAVFIDQAVTGDRARVRVVRRKKTYAEARALEILSPSPFRITAPCPYSGFCGGCKWQFVDYAQQLEFKRRHVVEALAHIGGIRDVPVYPTIASENIFGYRNKMEFSCARWRWLLPHELGRDDIPKAFALGLHVPGTFDKVIDIDACLLQPDTGNQILSMVREEMKSSGKEAYGQRDHSGFWRFAMLRHSVADDAWLVNLITSETDPDVLKPLAEKIMDRFPNIVTGVVNNVTDRKSAVAVGDVEIPLAGTPCLIERIGPFAFRVSANSFFQTNTVGAGKLYETVRGCAGLTGTEDLLDLYCGTGTIAITLSDAAARVTGIEVIPSAVEDARQNCRLNGIDNCSFIEGDIRQVLPSLTTTPQVVIIDPPRVGMHKDVVTAILEMGPPNMVYVSCNPSTLARDLALMAENYRIDSVQPVDLFPHTFHIESVVRLTRINR